MDFIPYWKFGICGGGSMDGPVSTAGIEMITPGDPNDKVGNPGAGPARFLSGAPPMNYSIYFDNIPTATASAQKVVVADQLNPAIVDLATLALGPISFVDKLAMPPTVPLSLVGTYSANVDLRPSQNLIVNIIATLNSTTGLLTWKFSSLDPATGQPTTDPLAGFLAPGTEGSVSFTVVPKPASTGAQITNKATIVFDVNPPMDTPVWLNTIDNTAPTSKVVSLSPTQASPNFSVQWSGTDEGSGIQDYTVYASDNGGPFTAWQTNTPATSAAFAGLVGHTYAFYAIARDLVGNIEGPKFAAETSTTITNVTAIAVTITSSPAGLGFSVTGTGCQEGSHSAGQVLQWNPGSSCIVSFASAQNGGAGTQYVFTGWADGGVTANPRTFSAPAAPVTYQANFKTQYLLTTALSPAGGGMVSGAGYYDSGASAPLSASASAGYQFAGWTGPVASASSASTTVAMSAPKSVTANFQLLTTTVVAAASGQYSDPVTLSATVGPPGTVFSGMLQFQVDGVNVGAAIAVTGPGSYTVSYTIDKPAGPHTITATFAPATPAVAGSSGRNTLTIGKEDATLTTVSGNPETVQVNTPGGSAGPITLTGKVQESPDGSLGDITKATVAVSLVPAVSGTATIVCPVTNAGGALMATCSNLPVNAYVVAWRVTGDYYVAPDVNTVLAVYDPSLGFVTGSGTVMHNGVAAEFAISAKYLKNGNPQGGLVYIEHRASGDVTVKTTAMSSLSLVGSTAVIDAKATVNGAGGYAVQVIVTDNGTPGINRDLFGIQLTGGTLNPPISFTPVAITGGNIQTH
jgi:uncharacterized repeat protein (TIGR02543 family)